MKPLESLKRSLSTKKISVIMLFAVSYLVADSAVPLAYDKTPAESVRIELQELSLLEKLLLNMKSENPFVRADAARALGEITDPIVTEPLIAALKDRDPFVRAYAAEALGKLKESQAVEPLITLLNDEDSFVQAYAAESLGEIKDPKAVDPLIAVLRNGNPDVRPNVAWALGALGDARAVEPLIHALKDERCLCEAVEALRVLTQQDLGTDHEGWKNWFNNMSQNHKGI